MEIEVGDGVAVCEAGDTLVCMWRRPASVKRWSWFTHHLTFLARKNPDGVLCLGLVLPSSTPPDAKTRSILQQDIKGFGSRLRKMVVVPLGDSTWLRVVRTVGRGIFLLSGQGAKHEIARGLDDGIRRIRALASRDTPSEQRLYAAAHALQKRLEAEPA